MRVQVTLWMSENSKDWRVGVLLNLETHKLKHLFSDEEVLPLWIQIDHIRDEMGGEEREDSGKGGEELGGGSFQKVETIVWIRWWKQEGH